MPIKSVVQLVLPTGIALAVSMSGTAQTQPAAELVSYSWRYGQAVHGTLQVPPGYKEETHNYREGIVTSLRYPDSSYIVLQHGGMYRIPMFEGDEYSVERDEERTDRTFRAGSLRGTDLSWREDNLKATRGAADSLWLEAFPPNIGYSRVPREAVDLFNMALNSFAEQGGAARSLHTLMDEYWDWRLREFPEQATWLGDHRYNDRLTDLSRAAIERRKAYVRQLLERVRAIDPSGLSGQDALSHAVLEWEIGLAVEGQQFPTEVLLLDQLDGPQLALPALVAATPFHTADDYSRYLTRLAAVERYLGGVTGLLESGIELGWVQPSGPLASVSDQIQGQIAGDVTRSPYYAPFEHMPEGIPAAERSRLTTAAQKIIAGSVFPALARFGTFVRETYLPRGRRAIAASTLPDGAAYYRYLIRRETTMAWTPDEVHAKGLAEVARIRREMEAVVVKSGFNGPFDAFLTFLRTDPRFYFTNAEDLVTAYRDIAKRADERLPALFAELPRNTYGVRAFADFEAPSQTTARYYPGASDGTRPGYFMVNTYRLDTRPKYEMEALTLHEAVPGHHLQIARAQELRELPAFRRNGIFTAFVEGWGLYAEGLGVEMGFYGDAYSKFGQLTYEMWRACRLVMDTGIHHLGWTRQQAIDFMKTNTAKSEHDITVEVDRYIVWPAQALAYKTGELKLRELRAKAERDLGARFDVRTFHNAVLDNGPLPLDLLEQQVGAWIAAQAAPR